MGRVYRRQQSLCRANRKKDSDTWVGEERGGIPYRAVTGRNRTSDGSAEGESALYRATKKRRGGRSHMTTFMVSYAITPRQSNRCAVWLYFV